MRYIRPIEVTAARLVESNVPEDDAPAWSSATTYQAGAVVRVSPYLYEALKATTNEPPADNTEGSNPAWLRLDNLNRWRMFNRRIGSATVASEPYDPEDYAVHPLDEPDGIAVAVAPGAPSDALAVLDVEAVHVDLIVETGDGVVFADRQLLGGELSVSDWWHWFFEPLQRRTEVAWFGLPLVSDATYRLSAFQPNTPARVGAVAIGRAVDVGQALVGTSVGIIDFSRKERDEFGGFDVVERAFAREMEVELAIHFSEITAVQRSLAAVRAVPVVWQASPLVDATLVYGFYRDFRITISSPTVCFGVITIEGLT